MTQRVAVVLQSTTDVPGRWRTEQVRVVAEPTADEKARMAMVVATVAADHACDVLAAGIAS